MFVRVKGLVGLVRSKGWVVLCWVVLVNSKGCVVLCCVLLCCFKEGLGWLVV